MQLGDQIFESFENNKHTHGVFIDLSKAFDTVGHSILPRKIANKSYKGEKSKDRSRAASQIEYNSFKLIKKINNKLRDSHLWFSRRVNFLFLLYVNDLKKGSNILDPIMFAKKTNLFFTHQYLRYIFQIVNQELKNINQWFISNKLSPNT